MVVAAIDGHGQAHYFTRGPPVFPVSVKVQPLLFHIQYLEDRRGLLHALLVTELSQMLQLTHFPGIPS